MFAPVVSLLWDRFFCGAAKSQLRHGNWFVKTRALLGKILMSTRRPTADKKPVSTFRLIVGSAAAGVGAMVLAGLIIPAMVTGGLNLTATAAPYTQRPQLIQPLDLPSINATLADVKGDLDTARAETDPMVNRLADAARQ